jgi:hypothetical protein
VKGVEAERWLTKVKALSPDLDYLLPELERMAIAYREEQERIREERTRRKDEEELQRFRKERPNFNWKNWEEKSREEQREEGRTWELFMYFRGDVPKSRGTEAKEQEASQWGKGYVCGTRPHRGLTK